MRLILGLRQFPAGIDGLIPQTGEGSPEWRGQPRDYRIPGTVVLQFGQNRVEAKAGIGPETNLADVPRQCGKTGFQKGRC